MLRSRRGRSGRPQAGSAQERGRPEEPAAPAPGSHGQSRGRGGVGRVDLGGQEEAGGRVDRHRDGAPLGVATSGVAFRVGVHRRSLDRQPGNGEVMTPLAGKVIKLFFFGPDAAA
jgi:hypothetical protein